LYICNSPAMANKNSTKVCFACFGWAANKTKA
jgi:hypothetical protein